MPQLQFGSTIPWSRRFCSTRVAPAKFVISLGHCRIWRRWFMFRQLSFSPKTSWWKRKFMRQKATGGITSNTRKTWTKTLLMRWHSSETAKLGVIIIKKTFPDFYVKDWHISRRTPTRSRRTWPNKFASTTRPSSIYRSSFIALQLSQVRRFVYSFCFQWTSEPIIHCSDWIRADFMLVRQP